MESLHVHPSSEGEWQAAGTSGRWPPGNSAHSHKWQMASRKLGPQRPLRPVGDGGEHWTPPSPAGGRAKSEHRRDHNEDLEEALTERADDHVAEMEDQDRIGGDREEICALDHQSLVHEAQR